MPATTPKGYPYPLGTDRVMDGDDSIHALATAVDNNLGVAASGSATTPVPGALNSAVSVAVTFPAGRFTTTPVVLATVFGTSPVSLGPATSGVVSTAGATLYSYRSQGGLAAITIQWFAVQL